MKKIITLVLALALLMTSVVAIAETHATPNINSFATMTVKYVGAKFARNTTYNNNPKKNDEYYEITLSKPVDRLLVNWTGKGEEPEELAVDENLKATAIVWNHKYMPGTEESYVTTYTKNNVTKKLTVNYKETVSESFTGLFEKEVVGSETIYHPLYNASTSYSPSSNHDVYTYQREYYYPTRTLDVTMKDPDGNRISWEDQVAEYMSDYPAASVFDYTIVAPQKVVDAKTGKVTWINGSIKRDAIITDGDVKPEQIQTRVATPAQTAFMTVQGEWAVYYNRAGKIVGIEYFEGQF
ncbi:MAG: hypothetical protein IKH57_20710 [Clostridia bacterium]|nr:hypothetical protein [Clostridia bacterium]